MRPFSQFSNTHFSSKVQMNMTLQWDATIEILKKQRFFDIIIIFHSSPSHHKWEGKNRILYHHTKDGPMRFDILFKQANAFRYPSICVLKSGKRNNKKKWKVKSETKSRRKKKAWHNNRNKINEVSWNTITKRKPFVNPIHGVWGTQRMIYAK